MICITLFPLFSFLTFLNLPTAHALRAGGAHVCAVTKTHNTYYVQHLTRISYDNYRTCCKRKWRICTSRCLRYRSKSVPYTKKSLRVTSSVVYECCRGWAPSGDQCTIAICNPRCQQGRCTSPNVCTCHNGFQGRYCESDIDECQNRPCSQVCKNTWGSYACGCKNGYFKTDPKNPHGARCNDVDECKELKPCRCASTVGGCTPICINSPGSYRCSCHSGYQLMFDRKTCVDVNECESKPCQQKCQNTPGSYKCYCEPGYKKTVGDPKEARCSDIDECAVLNGGCNQICINKPGTFRCTCLPGYQLSHNRRTCEDVNECESRPCSQVCQNFEGTYKCTCKPGYKKVATDPKDARCSDVDECKNPLLNGCSQICRNTVGSFACSCKQGYRLTNNKHSCNDINECAENKHNCQHNCHNSVGSFTCSCRAGYKLSADRKSCVALPCETITKPVNGKITCNGYVTGKSCSFTCIDGYELKGDSKRVCQTTGTWSGDLPVCERRQCPDFPLPQHGSVLEPCITRYGARCVTKCSAGYHLIGNRTSVCTVSEGKTKWSPKNALCKVSALCSPNPCLNGGMCKQETHSTFSCDCSGTSFTGQTCNLGLISMPSFPLMTVNEVSETLFLYANPKEVLEVRPIFDKASLKFEPEKINIYPSTGEASFEITALKVGSFKVKFDIYGIDASTFVKPKQVMIYSKQKIITQPVDISTNFISSNCKETLPQQCQGKVKLVSSCIWNNGTNGIVSVKSPKIHLPLSLTGVTEKTWTDFRTKKVLNPSIELKGYLQSRKLNASCATKCLNIQYNDNVIHYITSNSIFQRTYIDQANSLLPSYLRVNVDPKGRYFAANNFLSFIGDGNVVKKTAPCNKMESHADDLYSIYLPKSAFQFTIGASLKSINVLEQQTCIAVNLCKQTVSLWLHKSNYLGFERELSELGLENTKLTVKGFSYGDATHLCVQYEKEVPCLFVNSYADISLSTTMNANKTYLSIKGKMYFRSDDKFGVEKFSKVRTLVLKGTSFYRFKLQIFGSYISIRGKATKTEVYMKVGGSVSCPVCVGHGAKMRIGNSQLDFLYSYNILKFQALSDIHVHIPFNLQGGIMVGISRTSKDRLTLQMRSFKRTIPPQLNQLLQAIKSNLVETSIIRKYSDLFYKALTALESSLQNSSFSGVRQSLLKLKSAGDDFKSQLHGVEERNSKNIRVKFMSKFLINQLRVLRVLSIVGDTQKVNLNDQGQIISFNGSVCLYALCFSNVNIKIYDLVDFLNSSSCDKSCQAKYSPYVINGASIIIVTALKDQQLSDRIKYPKGTLIKFVLKRDVYGVSFTFEPFIKYFDNFQKSAMSVDNDNIKLVASDVKMFGNQLFSLKASAQLSTATWKSVTEKLHGSSLSFATNLLQNIKNEYASITNHTNKRLKVMKNRVKLSEENLRKGKLQFKDIDKKLKESQQNVRIEEAKYKTYLLEQHENQTKFDAQLKQLDPLFIKRNVETICKIEQCKQICIPMPVCETCKDPLILDVPSLKCEPKTEIIRENIMAAKLRPKGCAVTEYQFIPIYTGSCKPDPKEQKASDEQVKNAAVAIGSAVGSLWGPIGSGIGAAVGWVVGGILGMFSSCDRTYEVLKLSNVVQKDCVLLVPDIKPHTRLYSECFETKLQKQTGFKVPYTCHCQVNDCVAKGPEPACLGRNQQCEDKRKDFLQRTSKVPKTFTDRYNALLKCQENIAAAILKIQSANKTSQFHQREYKRMQNMLYAMEVEVMFAKQSQQHASGILQEEICVSNSYKNKPNITKLIDIKNIHFDVTLPLINNVRLNAQLKYQNMQMIIPFIYTFNNEKDVSLKAFGRKVILATLCQSNRRRRSADEKKLDNDLAFKPWHIDNEENATAVKLSCVTLERTLELLRDTVKKLNKKSNYANDLLMQLQYSSNRLNQALQSAFAVSTGAIKKTNDIIKANEQLLMSANSELNKLQQQVSVSHVLNTWQNEAEIVTGFNNVSVCLGYEDCVESAIETLTKLPAVITVPINVYMQEIKQLTTKFKYLYNEKNLIGISTTAQSIERSITYIKSISLHCSDPPKVSLIGGKDINIEKGRKMELKCSVSSNLPVTLYWKHNEKVLDGENSNTLQITMSREKIGLYSCIANSLVGNGTSSQILITGFEKPKFQAEPQDTIFAIPAYKEQKLTLTCNVTDFPESTIAWYYRSIVDDIPPNIIKNANQPLLTINGPTVQKSGYYFCQAFNKYGRVKSREARVDIVRRKLSDIEATIRFDVLKSNGVTVKSVSLLTTKMLAEVTSIEKNLSVKVSKLTDRDQITLVVSAYPSKSASKTIENMFSVASKARQQMGNAFSVVVGGLLNNDFKMGLNNGDVVKVDNETLNFGHKLNICQPGYKLHTDGFSCIQCPYGTAGNKCTPCPLNTYGDTPGLTSCKKCDYGKVTENEGATKKSKCLAIRSRKTDIIFAVDASSNFLRQSNVLPEIKKFITQFVQSFKGGANTRYSLISYYKYVDIFLTLDEYLHSSDLLSLLDLLDEGTSNKDTSEALSEARMVFEGESTNEQKKVLVILTNGFSQGDYSGTGFVKTKRETIALHRMGVHVIAAGTGSVDYAELRAMASYPKRENALSSYSLSNTLSGTLTSIDKFLSKKCFTPTLDFGVLLEGISGRSSTQLSRDISSITQLLMPILKVHSSQSYFFIPKGKSSSSDGFSTYSEANFKQKIDSYEKKKQ